MAKKKDPTAVVDADLRSDGKVKVTLQSTTLTVEKPTSMKITLPVSRFKQILKALGGVCNTRAVEPSYRYIGLRAAKTKESYRVDFVACNVDMMGIATFVDHPDLSVDGLSDDVAVDTLMIDSQLFSQLVDTLDSSASLSLQKDIENKSIKIVSGSHASEQQFNFDVRFEDFHKVDSFGGELNDEKWKRVALHLMPLIRQVDLCMPKDFQTDDYWLSGVHINLSEAPADDDNSAAGTWVQLHTSDMYRFAHFRFRHGAVLPVADLLIDHSIVAQIGRLDFTEFAFNDKAFCFYGGDSGVVLYTRALGSPSKFPNLDTVFAEFRAGKKPQILKLERDKLIPLLKRQCLFADQNEAMLYSDLDIDCKKNTLSWGADNRISRGHDELSFTPVSDNLKPQKLTVNPEGLLSYATRSEYSILHMLIAKQGNKTFLALCPDVKAAEVEPPAEAVLPGDDEQPSSSDDGEGESEKEKKSVPKLLGSLANSEFIFVTGAKAAK